ncbi:CUGBP Elav-like family member 3-B isoform X2 [Corticium candelabrum]|uniref:CUGBP Elav-like family member 3-B isoform X2 n=1 Tax=Corticium candelabrum TaxID=121492 RepID=UPI002E27639C|nr:CUGBP Elav-like family member 3-B isoform X2 [Corticium candelabrum]
MECGGTNSALSSNGTERSPTVGEKAADAIKLFIGQVPKQFSEEDLRTYFDEFGDIYELRILRNRYTNEHKGCAFITFCTRENALAAKELLHDKIVLPGMNRPMQIKLSEQEAKAEGRKLFIGMLPKAYSGEDVRQMFDKFGDIEEVNVLHDTAGISRGCAFVKYSSRPECEAAIQEMNGTQTLPGALSCLVVKYADSEKERSQRRMQKALQLQQQQLAAVTLSSHQYTALQQQWMQQMASFTNTHGGSSLASPSDMNGSISPTSTLSPVSGLPYVDYLGSAVSPTLGYHMYTHNGFIPQQPVHEGPEGANLFIYHLPQEARDTDLLQWFTPYGNVVSTKVYIDRITHQSKCFGFVSFDDPMSADAAISDMNGRQIGSKRLKVQHKRVKGYPPSPVSDQGPLQSTDFTAAMPASSF